MTDIVCIVLSIVLIFSLFAFLIMQYFYHLKLNAQTELSILQNQPAGESGFPEHVYHHDKHLDQIISRNNTMGFQLEIIVLRY